MCVCVCVCVSVCVSLCVCVCVCARARVEYWLKKYTKQIMGESGAGGVTVCTF
jgi:hypothetical protein